jgi:hypothetical protein
MNALRLDTALVTDSSGTLHEFLDYFVDDLRFLEWVGLMTGEPEKWQNSIRATPFRHDITKARRTDFHRMLTGKRPGDLLSNRVPLYVCSCCADYGCGVGSVELRIYGGAVEWSAFAPFTVDDVLADVPTLRFEKAAYESALSVALAIT